MNITDKQYQANRLSGYERTSAILWIAISVFQILSIYLIIAGIWNLISALNSFKLEKKILNRSADIPQIYESITELIIIAIVNVLFGGIIGVILVGFDFWIRQEILTHRDIFDNTSGIDIDKTTTNVSISNYEEFEKLYELKQKGVLTDEEYAKAKSHLL